LKNKLIIAFIFLLMVVLVYCGYKVYLLDKYKVKIKDDALVILNNPINTIEIETRPNNDEQLKFKNIIFNKFKDNFEFDEEISSPFGETYHVYYLNREDLSTYIALFKVGKTYSIYDLFTVDDVSKYDIDYKNIDRKKLLEKYDLANDTDIINYIISHYKDKLTIFSSQEKIEMNYLIKTIANIIFPNNITIISGDVMGYMYEIEENIDYLVYLNHNNENYFLGFTNNKDNNYFNLDSIKEFISTVKFES